MITVIGLGYSRDSVTLGALKALQQGKKVFLPSLRLPVAEALDGLNIAYETLDELFDRAEDFDALNGEIAAYLLHRDPCIYCVSGNGTDDRSVEALLMLAKEKGADIQIIPGVGAADRLTALCGYVGGCVTVNALDFTAPDIRRCTVITDIDDVILASELKCALLEAYPDEHRVFLLPAGQSRVTELPLYELDRQADYGTGCHLLIPPLAFGEVTRYDFTHLTEIMALLRSEQGCPWDREQDHKSIRQNMIEEAYEAVQAIDQEDTGKLYDELGDVLLQVVFHAQMGTDTGEFNISDVTTAVCEKLIRRHPHIFADVQAGTAEEVLQNWDQIKKGEKHYVRQSQIIGDLPEFPALLRTAKVLKRIAKTDYPLPTALETEERDMGRLLLQAVMLANQSGKSAEVELNAALNRLIDDFTQWEETRENQ